MSEENEADLLLKKAKVDYVLNKLKTPNVQKKFGAMFCYVQPILLTMIDLFGNSISLENLQNCLNSSVSLHRSNNSQPYAKTEFPYVKNINKQSGFYKPAIKLYFKNDAPETFNLVDFFENCIELDTTENSELKLSKDTEEQLSLIYKFVHEICHAMSFRKVSILKHGLPQPLDVYGTVVAKNGVLQIERSGICFEEFEIGNDGRIVDYQNLTPENCFYLLDEGVTEFLTKKIVTSDEFKKHLQDCGVFKMPHQQKQIYPRLCATVGLFESMFGDELTKAHFAGQSEIKNKRQVEIFGKFCEKLSELEEKIYFNSSLVYNAYNENNKDDAYFAVTTLETDFDEFNQLVFNFMNNNDTIMQARQFEKETTDLPKKYEQAVDQFVNSFDSIYEYVEPVYLDSENSHNSLKFWKANRKLDGQQAKHPV